MFYYRNFVSETMLTDGDFITGEHAIEYTDPVLAKGHITIARGDAESVEFGTDVKYDKTIVLPGTNWPITENSMLYIDDLNTSNAPDYKVVRVAVGLDHTTLAIAKVSR